MTALLEVRELETRFRTPTGLVRAVNRVSFTVQTGETLGLVGESGSGKSVTMLSLLRLLPPAAQVTGGEAWFEGQDLLRLRDRPLRRLRGHTIGMVFQDPLTSLNPVLTIERQLTESLRLHLRLSRRAARARALDLLEQVGIPSPAQRLRDYPHQFSGGMRQRVTIAIALACNPKLLIADEPTTALDVTIQAQIVELVKQLQADLGMATIWIAHDLALMAGLADRIAVMYAGQIVEIAPLHSLYQNPRHPYTLGLLQSIPRLDEQRRDRLPAIPGLPPDLAHYPSGCPFAARCTYALERCSQDDPPLVSLAEDPGHQVACWVQPPGAEVLRDRAA